MNIIFCGTPDFAVPALNAIHESEHKISLLVTAPDKAAGRGRKLRSSAIKVRAIELGLNLAQPDSLKSVDFLERVTEIQADIMVVVAFRILPKKLYSIPKFGAVNIHASLLPKYRGAAPIHHAILNGDDESGVTIFQIQQKVDTGQILAQRKIAIAPEQTTGEMWEILSKEGAELLMPTLEGISDGSIKAIPQEATLATPAPKIQKSDTRINWQLSAREIHNQIRAFSPFPGAACELQGHSVKLFNSKIVENSNFHEYPGTFSLQGSALQILCGKGSLLIEELQRAGKRRMTVSNFVKGHSINKELRFE